MKAVFPVTRSILSTTALSEVVGKEYAIGTPSDCQFLQFGLNDTYVLNTTAEAYIVRIYRKGWRSLSDIQYELDALLFLQNAGVRVSAPIQRVDERFVGTVYAPEGERFMVLFSYAPGRGLTYDSKYEDAACSYGKIAAQIHTVTEKFNTPHRRVPLDLEHLIDSPIRSIQPMLVHRQEDWEYLQAFTEKLRRQVAKLAGGLEEGFCHGDLHWGNAHVQEDRTLTLFDFDCCGMGWRSYDLAVFRWAARLRKKEAEQWPAFLRGYQEARTIREIELQAIPYFVALRQVWLMGLHVGNRQDFGMGWMNDTYFDQAITFLREWGAEHLSEVS